MTDPKTPSLSKSSSAAPVSRRNFLALGAVAGAAAALTPKLVGAQVFPKTEVWVQLTTGGKAYPPTLQEMFLDPMFFGQEIWPIDQPASFAALLPQSLATPARGGRAGQSAGRGAVGGGTARIEPADYPWEPSGGRPHPGYDVLVLNDQMNWPEDTRNIAKQAVEAGRGFVLLHHSLGDNQDWRWWYEEVTGGLMVLADQSGMKKSTTSNAAQLDLRPAGKHPIVRNIAPFSVGNEETYKGMWQSPKITPLLQTSSPGSDTTVAWVGVHPKARVVCIQPGTSRETHRNPAFRMLVRNAILWSAGRLI
jgi:hypothetical protein